MTTIKSVTRKQNFNCVEVTADNDLYNYCWSISKNNEEFKVMATSEISKELLQLALFVLLLNNSHDKTTKIKYNDEKFKTLVKILNETIFN